MINTALSAILITIATPLQFALTLFCSVPAAFVCKGIIQKEKHYPHLEIDAAVERIKFCEKIYKPGHRERAAAHLRTDALFCRLHSTGLLTTEDLEMYHELGICTDLRFKLLTDRFSESILNT